MKTLKSLWSLGACAAALLALPATHAATGSFTGNYATNFNGLGTTTNMPLGFRTMVTGSGNSVYTAAIPISTAGIAAATASGTQRLTVWTPPAASVASSTSLYNCGTHGDTSDRALGTDATSVAAMVIELSLTNNTGANLLGVIFSYDQKCMTNGNVGTEAGELPGYAFFYSTVGNNVAANWTRVEALSLTNSTPGTSVSSGNVTITFPVPLTNNGIMYFRWADDNNVANSPDQMFAIDNVVIGVSTNAFTGPTVAVTSPANGTVFAAGTNVTITADAADANGSVTKVEFFAGATKLGEDLSDPFSFAWTNIVIGTYSLTARATDDENLSVISAAVNVTVVPDLGTGAVHFDGVNDYITFGAATNTLGVSNFTAECWFKRTGPGATTSTGTGGVTAYPLFAKGRGEADGTNTDCNFFLGITASGTLTADFEDYNNGLNHPIVGTRTIISNDWQHAAVTYDVASGTWVLYLDGLPDATNVIAGSALLRTPRFDSRQHAGLATAMTSTGAAAGFFSGRLDEVRLWNYARSAADILAGFQQQITNAAGLIGRWALDETNGLSVASTGSSTVSGTLTSGPLFVQGYPFDNPPIPSQPPGVPVLVSPASGETGVTNPIMLSVTVSDPNTNALKVTFYGRPVATNAAGPDFTLMTLPDTQYYSGSVNGGVPAMFYSQTDWIINNRSNLNLAFVTHLGDIVERGDKNGTNDEWLVATNALYRLEDPLATLRANGIPYGLGLGNHDFGPSGGGSGTTTFFNQYFGVDHFSGYDYYGGSFGTTNNNSFQFFSAGGMDFIIIHLEYNTAATSTNAAVYAWANSVLQAYPNRRAIVTSHWIVNTGFNATFSAQGQTIYNALKGNPNLFLLLCGHVAGEGQRSDTFEGRTVYSILTDYQGRTGGGSGWLRYYTFSPSNNVIRAKTYSPWLNQTETDADSQFDIPYLMNGTAFAALATNTAAPGATTDYVWPFRQSDTEYEWYVTVSDGLFTTTSPVWKFMTGSISNPPSAPFVSLLSPASGTTLTNPPLVTLTASAVDLDGSITNVDFFANGIKLGQDTTAPAYNFVWNSPALGAYALTVVATDDAGLSSTSSVINLSIADYPPARVVRGPYLQLSTPTSIVIRWRTDFPSNSRVIYGTTAGDLNFTNFDAVLVTEHIVTLTGLTPDTKYFYAIGTASSLLNGPDANAYFITHPPVGSTKPLHVWVIGDAGIGGAEQVAVRDAFYNLNGARPVDGWLQLGDNAYNSGTDAEYQTGMFNVYTNLFRNSVTWPTLGNHDANNGSTAFVDTYPYFQIHTLPTAGEAGGVPSGTEHYYSFDLGMAHFICLDSQTASRATNGAMATWLRADLAANTNRWLIAMFHHPPYTKGSHNSDTESQLIQMRENFNPILEAGGVDLVLTGHSHSYERSHFIKGHYGLSTTFTTNLIVQPGSGRETNGVGAYVKPENLTTPPIGNHGAIYSVVGSSGQTSGGTLNHPANFVSLNLLGSMVLDITTNRLDAIFLRETGATNDSFTIIKTNFAPVAQNATFARAPGLSLKIKIADLIATRTSDVNADVVSFDGVGGSAQGAAVGTNGTYIFYDPANNNPDSFTYTVSDGRGGTTNATINVIIVNPGGITRSIVPVNGVVSLEFAGIPGYDYAVQHSTNLVDWTVRAILTAPPTGLFQFAETNAPSPSFYRLMQH